MILISKKPLPNAKTKIYIYDLFQEFYSFAVIFRYFVPFELIFRYGVKHRSDPVPQPHGQRGREPRECAGCWRQEEM